MNNLKRSANTADFIIVRRQNDNRIQAILLTV
jgi:hypothetical protein